MPTGCPDGTHRTAQRLSSELCQLRKTTLNYAQLTRGEPLQLGIITRRSIVPVVRLDLLQGVELFVFKLRIERAPFESFEAVKIFLPSRKALIGDVLRASVLRQRWAAGLYPVCLGAAGRRAIKILPI